jgi:hypothetical protein
MKMTLSEIGRVATIAEKACVVVIDHPTNAEARETLFNVLAPIVNPTFVGGHEGVSAYLHGLIRQACTLAEITRARIDTSRRQPARESFSAVSIQRGARDLQRVLSDLIQGLGAGKNG